LIRVNLTGVFYCMRAELRVMTGPGSIVNAASIASLEGYANNANYTASKHGVAGLTRSGAKEVGQKNIRVNAVAPGLVKTELLSRLFADPDKKRAIEAGSPMPLGGPFEPLAAAQLLAWLASEQNGHMTGQTIFIDGGADVVLRGDSTW